MKKILTVVRSLYFIKATLLLIFCMMLSACFGNQSKENKIKDFLNGTEFINAYALYNSDTATIPVVDVVIDKERTVDNYTIFCVVTQQNEDFIKKSSVIIYCDKLDDWYISSYNVTAEDITPIGGVPYSVLQGSVYEYRSIEQTINSVEHNFDETLLTDNITVNCTFRFDACVKEITYNISYEFGDGWKWRKVNSEKVAENMQWQLEKLVGTTWSCDLGFGGCRIIKINSIDDINHIISVDYGNSSLDQHEECSYEILENNDGEYLDVPLTYDFYHFKIYYNLLWYGKSLTQI